MNAQTGSIGRVFEKPGSCSCRARAGTDVALGGKDGTSAAAVAQDRAEEPKAKARLGGDSTYTLAGVTGLDCWMNEVV